MQMILANSHSLELDRVIKKLKSMRNIDEDCISTFKFFQIKKSYVKSSNSDQEHIMLNF